MTQLTLNLLGSFQAFCLGRPALRFPTDKVRALLVYLALAGERPLRRETLATLLWPDWPDALARRNLRQNLHRLKQALDDCEPGLNERLLTINRQTVQLNREWLTLDVWDFQSALTAVTGHPHQSLHTCAACLNSLTHAASLIHGDLLAGFILPDALLFDEWLTIERERYHRQSLQLLYTLADAHLQRGEYAYAYDYAARQVALEPWREEAHRQMMLALARQGRRSEALSQYAACARLLADELALTPAAETTALYAQIADEKISVVAATAVFPRCRHFPTSFTPFVGREEEIGQIINHLQNPACRLLTLLAPGGMGKTRLAVAAAEQLAGSQLWPDGLYFVSLAEVADRETLWVALAQAVGMPLAGVTDAPTSLLAFLADKNLLLLLDNFEQLVAEADLLNGLLTAVPHLQLLITSREPLNLHAERRLTLAGLAYLAAESAPPAAAQLFIQAAALVRPGFDPLSQIEAIQRICQLVEGMPLALEMAAAWTRVMSCAQIADQLADNLNLLINSRRDAPDRHYSVYTVFEQTWRLLTPDERQSLAQLALFHGSFSLEAAVVVAQTSVITLSILVDKAVIRLSQIGRYEMHPLLRQFALEKLTATLGDDGRRRHAAYFLQQIAARAADFHGPEAAALLSAYRPDLDNIRQAWQWAADRQDAALLSRSEKGIGRFFDLQGLCLEGAGLMAAAADSLGQNGEWDTAVAALYYREATLRLELRQYDQATARLHTARAIWEAADDKLNLSRALAELGIVSWRAGKLEQAAVYLQQSLELARQVDAKEELPHILHHLGNLAYSQGNEAAAMAQVAQSLAYYRELGDRRGMAGALNDLGALLTVQKLDSPQARAYYQESLDLYRQLGDQSGMTRPLNNLGYIALLAGEYAAARSLLEEAVAINRTIPSRIMTSELNNLGLVLLLGEKDTAAAAACFHEGLTLAVAANEQNVVADVLISLTATAVHQQQLDLVARLAGGIQARLGHLVGTTSLEAELYQQAQASARAGLGEAAFDALWAEGAQMSLSALILYAQQLSGRYGQSTPLTQ